MDEKEKQALKIWANKIRMAVIEEVYAGQSGHPGGSLSIADTLAYLYFKEMRIDPTNPRDPARDRFVLSKGHTSPALYGALALRGFFPESEWQGFRKTGGLLQG
ncbi:MAG: transketolase, partial [Oscillospiraceae bacterium]|nr:transketolase [Oscillospiraceae bacterium]